MKKAISLLLLSIRITALVQVLLGLGLWAGLPTGLAAVHMTIGMIFVISLLVLAVTGRRAGATTRLAALAAGWGIVIVVFGFSQKNILDGGLHWIVRLLHLAVGLAGVAFAERLAEAATSRPATAPSTG